MTNIGDEPMLIAQARILLLAGLIVLRLSAADAGRPLRWWNVIGMSALLLYFSILIVGAAWAWLSFPA